jgi:hypothetical protein
MTVRRLGCLALLLLSAAGVLLLLIAAFLPSAGPATVLDSPDRNWRALLRDEQRGMMFAPVLTVLYVEPNTLLGHWLGWLGYYKAATFLERDGSAKTRLHWCRENGLGVVLPADAREMQPMQTDAAVTVRFVSAPAMPCDSWFE